MALALSGLLLDGPAGCAGSPPAAWSLAAPGVRTEDMLLALSGAVNAPVRRGGHARLLANGSAALPALLDAIAGAKHSVHFMTYVWKPGRMSSQVFDALVAAARRGAAVRLLLDAHGGGGAPRDRIAELREAGGLVAFFRPLSAGLLAFNERNHRRAIVIDGRVGWTGGMGVADTWLGDAGDPQHWRDDLAEVTGPMARSLQSAFAQLWSYTTGELLAGPDVYPPDPDPEAPPDGTPVAFHVSVVSSPSDAARPLAKTWWLSFAGARKRIWITTPYFVPDETLLAVLEERARAGVDVRVLTAGRHIDIGLVRWAARHDYAPLLEAGVRIYEYQPTLIHAKRIVVDGIWSLVGSANLDVRSEEINQENLLAILDGSFSREMEATFERDLAHSREIDPEAWHRRGGLDRLREWGAAMLSEQL